MKYFILTLGLFLTTNIGFAQETKRLTAEKHNEYGLIYSLPQTHLDIEVVATKTTRKAGPYYQYAENIWEYREPLHKTPKNGRYLPSKLHPMEYPIPKNNI